MVCEHIYMKPPPPIIELENRIGFFRDTIKTAQIWPLDVMYLPDLSSDLYSKYIVYKHLLHKRQPAAVIKYVKVVTPCSREKEK